MTCHEHRDALVALARGEGDAQDLEHVRGHLKTCASCRRYFAEQQALTDALRTLAEASRHEQPPDALESRLMARFGEERTRAVALGAERPSARVRWWPAAAAAALVVGAVALWQTGRAPRTPEPLPAAQVASVVEVAGFQPLPQAAMLPDFDSGEIVRTEIALAALPVYGLAIPPDATSAAVQVDLLVGQDGQARMVRLVTEDQDSRSR